MNQFPRRDLIRLFLILFLHSVERVCQLWKDSIWFEKKSRREQHFRMLISLEYPRSLGKSKNSQTLLTLRVAIDNDSSSPDNWSRSFLPFDMNSKFFERCSQLNSVNSKICFRKFIFSSSSVEFLNFDSILHVDVMRSNHAGGKFIHFSYRVLLYISL